MSNIKIRVEPDKYLSTYFFAGEVTVEQIISAQAEFYSKEPMLFLLVDFTQADLSVLTSKDLRTILSGAEKNGHVRKGGKTAVVASGNLAFGMARMYEIMAEIQDLPFFVRAFRTQDEALMWLSRYD
jgi:hypothetical protein